MNVAPAIDRWRGAFGDAYTARNAATKNHLTNVTFLWQDIVDGMLHPVERVMEVGANVGSNLIALRNILASLACHAVEPNDLARAELVRNGVVKKDNAYRDIGDVGGTFDLIFTCGVLIHIHPGDLLEFCRQIHSHAGRYIVCIEYFAAEPEEKVYRGQSGLLWKRDFGSFWLDNFPDLKPLANGFAWKRTTGLDNLTWWLFERK